VSRFGWDEALALRVQVFVAQDPNNPPTEQHRRQRPPMTPAELPRFGNAVVGALLAAQMAGVCLITPALVVLSITGERERGPLALCQTTCLSTDAILVVKLLAVIVHMAFLVLAGLPVASLAVLWGGVDPGRLLAEFAVASVALLAVGGISLICAAT